MPRGSTIHVSLTPRQMRIVHERVRADGYASPDELIRVNLMALIAQKASRRNGAARTMKQELAAGYAACARHDRRTAQEWAQLSEAWPAK